MKRLVLVGGGHAHIEVLRRFGIARESGVEIVLVSPDRFTPYSGMIPGWIAGHYRFEDCHIDLERLAAFAGARFVPARAAALDPARRDIALDSGSPIDFDVISLDTGSTSPMLPDIDIAAAVMPVKPIAVFAAGLTPLDRRIGSGAVRRMVMVGGGVASVEVLLALEHRLAQQGQAPRVSYAVVTDRPEILPGQNRRARLLLERVLAARQIAVHTGFDVVRISESAIHAADGRVLPVDVTILATGAAAPAWPAESGLACDDRGFVRVDASLQSISHPGAFAAGDVASLVGHAVPKAGVYAVRQGPVLAANLRRALRGEPLGKYEPQTRALALIATGGRHAVGARGSLALSAGWLWALKDRIDRRFMARYTA